MPLPHFLLTLLAVIAAAALTVWLAFSAGIPIAVLGLLFVIAAMVVHFIGRESGKRDRRHSHDRL